MTGVRLAGPPPERMTPARKRVLDTAADGLAWSKSGLAAAAGVSSGVVDGLLAGGTLEVVTLPSRPIAADLDPDHARPDLSAAQERAAAALRGAMGEGFSVSLLDGVTGSGKTEVYFEAVAETLRRGKQALILLPEIALTGAFLDRFAARFGSRPAEWHSEVGARQRERVWRAVARRRGEGAGRRALGALPAVSQPRAHRRRRGARLRLQAGGGRHLPRARHGGGAGQSLRVPGRAFLGHSLGREPRQRRSRALRPSAASRALRRRHSARSRGHRPEATSAGARAAGSRRRS